MYLTEYVITLVSEVVLPSQKVKNHANSIPLVPACHIENLRMGQHPHDLKLIAEYERSQCLQVSTNNRFQWKTITHSLCQNENSAYSSKLSQLYDKLQDLNSEQKVCDVAVLKNSLLSDVHIYVERKCNRCRLTCIQQSLRRQERSCMIHHLCSHDFHGLLVASDLEQ